MNRKIGYAIAKMMGKLHRDKHKETLNKWFIRQGVQLEMGGGGVQAGLIYVQI